MDKRTKFEEHERKESPNASVCASCHNLIFYFLVEKIYRVEHWNCNVTLIQVCNTGTSSADSLEIIYLCIHGG